LKESNTGVRERFAELVNLDSMDLWKSFKVGVLTACDELCGKTLVRRDRGNYMVVE